jgi:hypothetical protein
VRADPNGWQQAVAQHGQVDPTARQNMAPDELARWDGARARASMVLELGEAGGSAHGSRRAVADPCPMRTDVLSCGGPKCCCAVGRPVNGPRSDR